MPFDELTQQRIQNHERQCELFEALLTATLSERIQGLPIEQRRHFIADWFKSVRTMAVANWIASGIETRVEHL